MPEVQHISCNTGASALPDMSTLGCRMYISGNAFISVLQLLLVNPCCDYRLSLKYVWNIKFVVTVVVVVYLAS